MRPSRQVTRALRTFSTSTTTPAASTSTSYSAPLKSGVLPAYDQALAYIAQDRKDKLSQLEKLKKQKEVDQTLLEKLEVEAWANDPETRWRAASGSGDLSKPVYRHLAERKWRKDGELAILMQRVTQMSVTPDLLPSISPVVDVKISIGGETIVPGVFTSPASTRDGVEVSAQVFHPEERLYTLLLVDPDVPDEANHSFTTYAHWLIPNIPLSSTVSSITAPSLLSYIPPHPQNGTPYHRYTILLLSQPTSLTLAAESLDRESFDVRQFVKEHGLTAEGVSFFRQKWDKSVSEIYEQVLGVKEPRFGRAPKVDTYEGRPPKYEVV